MIFGGMSSEDGSGRKRDNESDIGLREDSAFAFSGFNYDSSSKQTIGGANGSGFADGASRDSIVNVGKSRADSFGE